MRMPEKKGTPEKVKVNYLPSPGVECNPPPPPQSHSPPVPLQCHRYRGHVPHTFWKADFSTLEHFAAQEFFAMAPALPPKNTISFPLACIVNILRYQVICLSHQTTGIIQSCQLCPNLRLRRAVHPHPV